VRANWDEDLPAAGILDREEVEARRYRGFNPAFVRQVWERRRAQAHEPRPNKTWTPERLALVVELLKAGKSYGQIAIRLGVTPSAISGKVNGTPELRAIGPQSEQGQKQRAVSIGRTLREAR
jgi:predicted transcriptional regulator